MTDIKNISKAVASAIKDVYILGKGDRNQHGGYQFASIDKFLEMVNPICGKHGLFPVMNCVGIEYYEGTTKNGKSIWGRHSFEITLTHESGETLPAQTIIVPVQITGAQASGSAQSYALKQYFRGLLMIPTGDRDDPDFNKPVEFVDGTISADQAAVLNAEIARIGANPEKFLSFFNVSSMQDLPLSRYGQATAMLEAKAKQASQVTQEEADALVSGAE